MANLKEWKLENCIIAVPETVNQDRLTDALIAAVEGLAGYTTFMLSPYTKVDATHDAEDIAAMQVGERVDRIRQVARRRDSTGKRVSPNRHAQRQVGARAHARKPATR
jgi:hypothetical protein